MLWCQFTSNFPFKLVRQRQKPYNKLSGYPTCIKYDDPVCLASSKHYFCYCPAF